MRKGCLPFEGVDIEYVKKAQFTSVLCASVETYRKLIFGVSNNDEYIGVEDAKDLSEKASELIKMRMDPIPPINMEIRRIENKDYVIIHIPAGEETPYYYVGDGSHTAFVRIGNERVPADAQALRRLVLKGTHQSFDSLVSKYRLSDFYFHQAEICISGSDRKRII